MGRYFGIGNTTKKQIVSGGWKNDQWCDCHHVMHQMHWEKTDMIYSASYCDLYKFKYDQDTNKMKPNCVMDETFIVLPKKDCLKVGFCVTSNDIDQDHVPSWENNVCTHCGYIYDESKIHSYVKKYDDVFCMN